MIDIHHQPWSYIPYFDLITPLAITLWCLVCRWSRAIRSTSSSLCVFYNSHTDARLHTIKLTLFLLLYFFWSVRWFFLLFLNQVIILHAMKFRMFPIFLAALWTKPRALQMPGKHPTSELQPQPLLFKRSPCALRLASNHLEGRSRRIST